jgi:hypothetical protein
MYLLWLYLPTDAETLTRLRRQQEAQHDVVSRFHIANPDKCAYSGDILARKTWTPSYLVTYPEKSVKIMNSTEKRTTIDHYFEGRFSFAVQRMIRMPNGKQGILPELKVIDDGALKGFVSIIPRWAASRADDFSSALASVYEK